MDYNFTLIEQKWQAYWQQNEVYATPNQSDKPKYYVLDMFPYPSGDGLHVGHPLGYIASDIFSRFMRMKGYNVLHPMGFDAFGLPAEQYAIQTGQHPEITTHRNIKRFKEQLQLLGLSYDWNRELATCDPNFYKWTQWIFLQLFDCWYNKTTDRAERIGALIEHFENYGTARLEANCSEGTPAFTADDWKNMSGEERSKILMDYRLCYQSYAIVNWCPELGTVLANDEVKDGVSERGGHPVHRIPMRQWFLRTTAYAERLLQGLETIDWPESTKEMQRNWIGKSLGAEVTFKVEKPDIELTVFTTRIDTIYGVTFLSIAPEHGWVEQLTTPEQETAVQKYVAAAKNRSERDRNADTKTVSGVFTGSYAINPFNGEKVPIWVADYVLAGYGTGVVMAVPSSDDRDFRFAKHFGLPVICVIEGTENMENPTDVKTGNMVNSGILNGLDWQTAIHTAIDHAVKNNFGKAKVNYKIRDAGYSRQRYWGEPFPVIYRNGTAYALPEEELPLLLPPVQSYQPTGNGKSPLANLQSWVNTPQGERETDTMPGYAGSSWYYLRYMDPTNHNEFVSKEAEQYWQNVDFYIGGAEHATGHLIYSRMWHKFLYDMGWVSAEEPFKKLLNQGMIQGRSNFAYRIKNTNTFVSYGLKDQYETTELHVNVALVESGDVLNIPAFKEWRPDFADAGFILEDGKYICGWAIEKMSKSKYNVVNPDVMVAKYGADCLRMYEMFLGPLTDSKPWNTEGIEGVSRFLRKFWRLFKIENNQPQLSADAPTPEELKALHKTIKKVTDDIERLSLNTAVSAFMECVNDLFTLKSANRSILEQLTTLMAPFAPHLCEELWFLLGNTQSVHLAAYPVCNPDYIKEDTFEYPVQVNGKLRHRITLPLGYTEEEAKTAVLADEKVTEWIPNGAVKKFIFLKGRIINVVV
ncbi:leucine--tRNA ligase [Sphingobacteriales bacterium UPWRP_1]|nr:leucine--tRNA ligase [Sphingobacteriales bacterium TSM_CSM]PSJ78479.1 leucine--tRNA ligase [Sphingobacteriales bacterium UPWRP_1]